ncbi:MAG: ABC transporter substrate-binding protein [Actinomycetota bacterium]
MSRLVVVVVMLVSVACTGGGGPGGDDATDTNRSFSIQVFGEPEEIAVYHTLIERYEDEEPGVDIELIDIAEREDHMARLATDFAAGDPSDIFLINFREYSQFVARGAVEPIEELMTERGIDLADYFDPPIEAFTFDGALQCMPQNVSSLAVYYNTRLFKRAGIDPPHDGWGWEEFRSAAAALTQGDVDGVGIDAQIIRLAPFAWSNGGEITDDPDDPTRFTLEDPATKEALEFLVGLVRDGYVPSEEELASQDPETRFINGKLGMLLSSRRDTPQFREVAALKWDVLPLPVAEEPAGILHSDAYCIAAASDAKDAAADFVAWANQEDGQTIAALSGRTVPSLTSIAESRAFLDPTQAPRHSEVFIDTIATVRYTPVLPTWPEIEDIADEILTKVFYEEGYTIEDATRELDERANPLFAEGAQG